MSITRDIAPPSEIDIIDLVHIVHEKPVVFDRDIATLYRMKPAELNRIANRNAEFFPNDFRFQLTKTEFGELFPSEKLSAKTKVPFAYTEQGITMLALILKDVQSSVNIIRAFVELRNFVAKNAPLFERISSIELKQLEYEKTTDKKIAKLLAHIEEQECAGSTQKIFFSGQIYDAFSFLVDLVKRAKEDILLVDGYININTLDILKNKREGVEVSILALPSAKLSSNEVRKFNAEYPLLKVYKTKDFHDRLSILDRKEFYHIGASLKDAGEKSFAITKLEEERETKLLLSRIDKITDAKSPMSQKPLA